MQCLYNINNKRVFTEMEGEDTAHIGYCTYGTYQVDTYTRKYVPIFDHVKELREYLLSNFKGELSPVCSEVHLAEAYSNSKDGWVTL